MLDLFLKFLPVLKGDTEKPIASLALVWRAQYMILASGQELVFRCVIFHRDLCTAFGKDVLKLVEARPMIHELLTEGRRSKTNKAKTLATWATKELRKLKNQAW